MNCKKCGNKFKSKVFIDGKYRNLAHRKYCLDCSPFGEHNTKKLDIVENLNACICRVCARVFRFSIKAGNNKSLCNSCRTKLRRHRMKIRVVEYLGGRCVKCNYAKSAAALDAHHIDPNSKIDSISGLYGSSWERVKQEADKCELLCANCHRELHGDVI